jgi:hypothetical protein
MSCAGPISSSCAVTLQHSCVSPINTAFFGDPAVRLSQVVQSVMSHQLTSVCDTDYTSALTGIGELLVSTIGAGCLRSPLPDPASPDCTVDDVTLEQDGTIVTNAIANCTVNGGAAPCWKLQAIDVARCKPVCAADGQPGQHFGVIIDRGPGGQPPANTTARVTCTTVNVDPDHAPLCGLPL